MSQPKSPLSRVTSVRGARVVLVALLLSWGGLLLWTLRHGERLLAASADAAAVASTTGVVASGALPGDASPLDDAAPLAGSTVAAGASSGVADAVASDDANGAAVGSTDADGGEREAVGSERADGALAAAPDAAMTTPSAAENDGREASSVAADGTASGGVEASGAEAAGRGRIDDPDEPDVSSAEIEVAGGVDSPAPGDGGPASAEPRAEADTDAGAGSDAVPDDRAESVFAVRRREELATLSTLLEALRFEPLGSAPSTDSRAPLERAFEILFLYPDTRLELVVEGRESNDAAFDRRLGNERADAIVDYLVSRGIERERLAARGGEGAGLPFGEHRVRVTVEDENR